MSLWKWLTETKEEPKQSLPKHPTKQQEYDMMKKAFEEGRKTRREKAQIEIDEFLEKQKSEPKYFLSISDSLNGTFMTDDCEPYTSFYEGSHPFHTEGPRGFPSSIDYDIYYLRQQMNYTVVKLTLRTSREVAEQEAKQILNSDYHHKKSDTFIPKAEIKRVTIHKA